MSFATSATEWGLLVLELMASREGQSISCIVGGRHGGEGRNTAGALFTAQGRKGSCPLSGLFGKNADVPVGVSGTQIAKKSVGFALLVFHPLFNLVTTRCFHPDSEKSILSHLRTAVDMPDT